MEIVKNDTFTNEENNNITKNGNNNNNDQNSNKDKQLIQKIIILLIEKNKNLFENQNYHNSKSIIQFEIEIQNQIVLNLNKYKNHIYSFILITILINNHFFNYNNKIL